MKKISYVLLIIFLFTVLVLSLNMRQNVNYEKIFSKESTETDNLKCNASVVGQWHEYVLDSKTSLYCYEEPYDIVFKFITSDKFFKAIRIDRCEIKYQNVSLQGDVIDFLNVIEQFETDPETGDKQLFICLANTVHHHNHFRCIIHASIIDENNKETKQTFKFNFSTAHKGDRNFSVIEAISSI